VWYVLAVARLQWQDERGTPMPLKKSELYASLWKSCDELRGGMDASQYKDYVLVLLFVKYVSDKYAGQKDALIDVPEGARFADLVSLKSKKDIGERMNIVIGKLADANPQLKGAIDVADWNDEAKLGKGSEMVTTLSKLVGIFEQLDFSKNRADGDDILGDAYEYLMRHFATESGKSKGQFYTPAEVSRIMARVIGLGSARDSKQTIYDPACGSGSLLLKAHDEAKAATGKDLAVYGQEKDVATKALAVMNMILHNCPTAEIWKDNTIAAPHFKEKDGGLKKFDFIVANPPFSTKAWSNGIDPAHDDFKRFEYGVPPPKNGDYAFLLHIVASLKSTGKGACILPHGVLFRGNAEADIRRQLVKRGLIKGIIGLPANLFYGTGIPACIVVVDKEGAEARSKPESGGIFMLDASKGFIKDGNKNRLRAQDLHKIVDVFTKQLEVPRYSRFVPLQEIADPKNDYNLNLPRYIDASEPEDIQDIEGHLKGGIPARDLDALEAYWKVFPGVRKVLVGPADRPGYHQLKVKTADIKTTIFTHPEFTAFNDGVLKLFDKWRSKNVAKLKALKIGDRPKELIDTLAEDLLTTFKDAPLIDAYDVYQRLMDYWGSTMQDDVYMIVQDGWAAIVENKPNTALIPETLLVQRYFEAEQKVVEQREAEAAAITRQMEEMDEEHGGEEGLLAEAKNDKGKLTKASVKARLSEVNLDPEANDEKKTLLDYLDLIEKESAANKRAKDAQKALDAKVAAKYAQLSSDDVKTIIVHDKWLQALSAGLLDQLGLISRRLTGRVNELADRYSMPLPTLRALVSSLSNRVDEHLRKMGASWN
jgi:type I restriction enzyme M protein